MGKLKESGAQRVEESGTLEALRDHVSDLEAQLHLAQLQLDDKQLELDRLRPGSRKSSSQQRHRGYDRRMLGSAGASLDEPRLGSAGSQGAYHAEAAERYLLLSAEGQRMARQQSAGGSDGGGSPKGQRGSTPGGGGAANARAATTPPGGASATSPGAQKQSSPAAAGKGKGHRGEVGSGATAGRSLPSLPPISQMGPSPPPPAVGSPLGATSRSSPSTVRAQAGSRRGDSSVASPPTTAATLSIVPTGAGAMRNEALAFTPAGTVELLAQVMGELRPWGKRTLDAPVLTSSSVAAPRYGLEGSPSPPRRQR